ncbi:glycosyltransferase [Pedobacter sp. LMG 31464]|uniref:Glycosyltransferase n=1 Tax=Pedobacter planticolens TaxID=2679964 RepID=A0A923DZ57_9SPHI|nr:glycosyltransferase [Pedobacter planticolens]
MSTATKSLKIFVDGHVFDKEYQGSQTFLKGLYTQLMIDYPLLEIYFGVQNVAKFNIEFPGFPENRILIYKKRRLSLLRFLFDIPLFLKKHQFDFAHFQYTSPKQIKGCKYIVTLHDTLFSDFKTEFGLIYRFSRNLLFGRSIKNAAMKTTVSEYSRQQIHKHYHIAIQQLHVVPNGIDLSKIKTETLKEDAVKVVDKKFGVKNFILYVSRIEPRKNHLLLLKTYLKLKLYQQNIALVFIGKESIPIKELNFLIENLNNEQRKLFYWIEQVEQSDLNNFYLASRLFVYPSKAEGFGIPPLEAAGFHCPVLCSNATAMKDFDFFEPHIFNPQNKNEFEQKLTSILASPPSNDFLNKVANQVQEKYNWQHSGNLFYNLLTTYQ